MSLHERMMSWLDERTGARGALRRAFDAALPGGPRWRYVFGAVLLALIVVEVVTGLAMMTVYAPGAQTAWASTYYLQHVLPWGGWVRAIHHHASHGLVVTIGAHMLQVIVAGGHRRPREVNWWIGLALAGLILGFAVTGFPLAWDQRGYWVSRIETGIMGSVPVVGPATQRLFQGGAQYGTLTLTRFFTLHVLVLPALLAALVGAHLALFRRHGVTPPGEGPPAETSPDEQPRWWPAQASRDALAAMAAVLLVLAVARAKGVWLDAPADAQSNYPARPEWYFTPLSQLIKYFHGGAQFVGSVLIPGALAGYLVALPWLDGPGRKGPRRLAPLAPLAFAVVAATALGATLMRQDRADRDFQKSTQEARARARRAVELARHGVPPEGPLEMLRNDPAVRPRQLFAQHCGTCHAARGVSEEHKAPRLDGFGSRRWAEAFIMWPDAPELMGTTEIHDMPSMLRRIGPNGVRATAEWLYSRGVERGDPPPDPALVAEGDRIYHERCTRCHLGDGDRSETEASSRDAPDLDTWGSRDWVRMQILNPQIHEMYGERNRMTRFQNKLNERELDMILDFVRTLRTREAPAPVPPPDETTEAPAAALTPTPSDGNGSAPTTETGNAGESSGSSDDGSAAGGAAPGGRARAARRRAR